MADRGINQLPVSGGLTDDGLLAVYQSGQTQSIKGELQIHLPNICPVRQ